MVKDLGISEQSEPLYDIHPGELIRLPPLLSAVDSWLWGQHGRLGLAILHVYFLCPERYSTIFISRAHSSCKKLLQF